MYSKQIILFIINIVGGILVIGSYVYVFKTLPQAQTALWGGVPVKLRNLYFISMLLAAVSYFAFTLFILIKIKPDEITIGGIFGYSLFLVLYLLMLLPSALWGPLTSAWITSHKDIVWISIRIVLAVVALASLAILISLLLMRPKQTGLFYWSAIIGITIFFLHTGILDAIVWSYYFRT